jgi:hypothetical protein
MNMCLSSTHEPHVGLAIDVFRSQNLALLMSLKDFLTILQNPKFVEEIFISAIYQLAECDVEACRWLLRNYAYLEPEVDLMELTMNLARTKLEKEGFILNRDFSVVLNIGLNISKEAKNRLMVEDSVGDRLLLEEILLLDLL